MQFGIDASRATKPQPTGTEYYSAEIIKALAELNTKHEFILYSPVEPTGELAALPNNFRWKVIPFPRLWSQVRLSAEFLSRRPLSEVVFEPAHTVPLFHPRGMVTTIHDLGFFRFPELYTSLERYYHGYSFRFSTKHSAHIIAVSEATKKDILHFAPKTPPEKITVIHHGYHNKVYKPALKPLKKIAVGYRMIEAPYFFFVGRIEEKKNISRTLTAFEQFNRRHPQYSLVLAGKPGYGYERFRSQIMEYPFAIRSRIYFLGYASEEHVALLMQHAAAFVFPSLFEGFGMPLLEAMAAHTPVICSDTTSLPEVAGDAALQVGPRDTKALVHAFGEVVKPEVRNKLVKLGEKRVKQFSWRKAAKETLAVLESVATEIARR